MNRRSFARAALGLGAAASGLGACASARLAAAPAESDVLAEARAGGATPGIAALVIRNLEPLPELVSGVRALGSPELVAPGDRWHPGSNGKAMTATLIARLVEQGALSWERPLAEMLPRLADAMQEPYRGVTLPDLLAHRAGLPENITDMEVFNSFYADGSPHTAQRLRYIEACLREAPVGRARAEPSYSNTGFLIAGACAEAATGRDFESLLAELVFTPLGMRSVSYEQFGGPGEPRGHVDGRVADRERDVNPRMFAPAGAMRMSLPDWARFCIEHMQGERGQGRLLRAETYRFLHAGQGETDSALGWGVAANPMNLRGPALTHAGSDGNWYALVCLFHETGNGVLVAANAADSMGGDRSAGAAIQALAGTVAAPKSVG